MTHDQELTEYILEGMARAIWVQAFTRWASEVDPPPTLRGDTWEESAPNTASTRSASMKAARALAEFIEQSNSTHRDALINAFRRVRRTFDPGGTEADRAYAFGRKIAGMSMGVLPIEDIGLNMPTFEVSLDDDGQALTWDGGMSWHQNPPQRHPPAPPTPRGRPLTEEDGWKANPQWRSSQVQSLLFSTRKYSVGQAKRWAQDHGYKYGAVDTTESYHRLRQFEPDGRPCRTIDFGRDIRAIVCATKNPAAVSPQEFGAAVNQLATEVEQGIGHHGMPKGRFGREGGGAKVFIAAIWRLAQQDPRLCGMTRDQFNQNLIEANRRGFVVLGRADLVGAMDSAEVADSEIQDRGAEYHFVIDRTFREPWER